MAVAKRRAHDGRSTVASLFRNGSSIERLRYLVSHSNCRFQVPTNGAQLVAHREAAVRSPPATRSSSREAGSSAACTEPSSASERCSAGSSSPSMHYLSAPRPTDSGEREEVLPASDSTGATSTSGHSGQKSSADHRYLSSICTQP